MAPTLVHVIVAFAVEPTGIVGRPWGKAPTVAVASVADAQITDWQEFPVGWDTAHDQGGRGEHHALVVTFLRSTAMSCGYRPLCAVR